jgi:hypothetical protein
MSAQSEERRHPVAYPPMVETERMSSVARSGHSQAIGEFLQWCTDQGWELCHLVPNEAGWPDEVQFLPVPAARDIPVLLALYFKIDMDKVEAERRALLEHIRREG